MGRIHFIGLAALFAALTLGCLDAEPLPPSRTLYEITAYRNDGVLRGEFLAHEIVACSHGFLSFRDCERPGITTLSELGRVEIDILVSKP